MVLGYWDMAASLVTPGQSMPRRPCSSREIFATFAKVQPFLDEIRRARSEPDFCTHLEKVVMADPNASAIMRRRREAIQAVAKSRSSI